MDHPPRLQPGIRVRCSRCRRIHALIRPYDIGSDYTRAMLFVNCGGKRYYVGQEDATSQLPAQITDAS